MLIVVDRLQKDEDVTISGITVDGEWQCLRHVLPSDSVDGSVDGSSPYRKELLQIGCRDASISQISHQTHRLGRQLRFWVGFSAAVAKSCSNGMRDVLRRSDPFKVIRTIVGLDPIDVVDGRPHSIGKAKPSHCDKAMHFNHASLVLPA